MRSPLHKGDQSVRNIVLKLWDSSNSAVSGKTYNDITIKYKPLGTSTWTTPSLQAGNESSPVSNGFVEDNEGGGLYWYGIPTSAFAGADQLLIKWSGSGFVSDEMLVPIWSIDVYDSLYGGISGIKNVYDLSSWASGEILGLSDNVDLIRLIDAYNSGQLDTINATVLGISSYSNVLDLYISGQLDATHTLVSNLVSYSPLLDQYISGAISTLTTYNSIYDEYISGQTDILEQLDIWLSGAIQGINSYNESLDLWLSGQVNSYNVWSTDQLTYISGKIDDLGVGGNSTLDEYISGVVSTLTSYSSLYDEYVSGQTDKLEQLDLWLSGATQNITSYNNSLDLWISGQTSSINDQLILTTYISGKIDSLPASQNNLLDEYISGVVSTLTTYNSLYDEYISGQTQVLEQLDIWLSGAILNINLYNDSVDLWLSGETSSINSQLMELYPLSQYISGKVDSLSFDHVDKSLDEYISGVVSNLTTYSSLYDEYVSGNTDKLYLLDLWTSGAISNMAAYGNFLSFISGLSTEQLSYDIWSSGQFINISVPSVSVTVAPLSASVPARVNGTNITYYVGELKSTTVAITDSNDQEVLLENKTIQLHIDAINGSDQFLLDTNDITVSGNQFSFTNPANLTNEPKTYMWALRDFSYGNEVLARGQIRVEDSAMVEQ